jgi:hypothetical protein
MSVRRANAWVWDSIVREGLVWFWDMDGQPCSMRTWADLMNKPERILRQTVFADHEVVTAWLGVNEGTPLPPGEEPNCNFGVLVKIGGEVSSETFYPTAEAALAAHNALFPTARDVYRGEMRKLQQPDENLKDENLRFSNPGGGGEWTS